MGILKNNIDTGFFEQWVDCFKEPILLVDEAGTVVFANMAASDLYEQIDPISAECNINNASFVAGNTWDEIYGLIKAQKEYSFEVLLPYPFKKDQLLRVHAQYLSNKEYMYLVFRVQVVYDEEKSAIVFERNPDILASILKNTNEAFFFVDAVSKKILDCNDRALILFDAEYKHELIGIKGSELHYYPMSEDEKRVAVQNENSLNGWESDILYKSKKGRKFWGRINVLKITLNDIDLLLVRISDNDNEKKAFQKLTLSEKKYRDLITYNQALICTHDLDGVIISVNPACIEALKLDEQDIIGKNLKVLFDRKRHAEYNQYIQKINEEDRVSGIMEVLDKDGNKMYWLYHNYKVSEEGEIPYVVGSAKDITERMVMEKELIQAKTQAISSLKARELFLANVSHEIRTPMNGVIGVLELLNKTTLTNLQAKYIDIIQNSSDRLLVIINDILDYAKIESGTIQMENVPFDIVHASMSVIQPLLLKGIDKKIELHVDLEKPSTMFIGDPYRYGQVITNLINNAVKFTNNGEVSVIGKVLSETESSIVYEIKVLDTGIGMSKDDMSKIFNEFTQAHISHTRKYGGTGLGLSICKKLIEMQGGTLKVYSKPDIGSEFVITYTFTKALNILPDELIQTKVDPEAIKGIRMLLVEDNEVNQYVVKTVAELNGIRIDIADTGIKAVSMLQKNTYDVVLMDIQMPDMDGIETTSMIRGKISMTIPIIAYTANAMKGDLEKYITNGMNDYLSKPLKQDELLNKIGKVLKLPFIKVSTGTSMNESEINNGDSLYSIGYLKTLGNNRPEFIKAMLEAFVNSMPRELEKLNRAFLENNLTEIKEIVHKIKSSAKTLMISSVEENIYFIEKYSEPVLNDRFNAAIATIIDVLKQVAASIRKDLKMQ